MKLFIALIIYLSIELTFSVEDKPTRWGVLGAGKISHDFVTSVRSFNNNDHQFVAVATRNSLSRAKDFANLQNIRKAYGSYEELGKDPDVEVVYIGVINNIHFPAARLMLENGKHLLVEKPFAINLNQTQELFDLAKSKNLFIMEALWSRFLPSYQFVFNQIKERAIGDIFHVTATFGLLSYNLSREFGGGMIQDLGGYCINIIEQVYNGEKPQRIRSIGQLNSNGVDISVVSGFKFRNNRTATFEVNSIVELRNEAMIYGTKGRIRIGANFNGAQRVYVNEVLHEFPFPSTVLPLIYPGASGLRYEANEVRKCLLEGKLESDVMPHRDSVMNVKIRDEIRRQVGVKFDVD